MRRLASALCGLVVMSSGCSNFMNKFTVNSTAPVLKIAAGSMEAESDVELARAAVPGSLKTVDGFLHANPTHPDLLEVVATGYVQYGLVFLEDELEQLPDGDSPTRRKLVDRATNMYDRAFGVALRLVALHDKKFPALVKADQASFDQGLARLKKRAAPGLFWAGFALASAINLHRDDIDRVAELPRALALIERAYALDPSYFNHGAALALGVVYASQGKAVGGNPEKSKKFFDEVVSATQGKFLMAQVMFARFYATVVQDRALFEKTLKDVLATPASVWPEQRLANEIAHIKAARYLKQADELF